MKVGRAAAIRWIVFGINGVTFGCGSMFESGPSTRGACGYDVNASGSRAARGVHDPAVLQRHYPGAQVEITIVMGDDYNRFAPIAQVRQDITIKDILVLRILIGRPFVEHVIR